MIHFSFFLGMCLSGEMEMFSILLDKIQISSFWREFIRHISYSYEPKKDEYVNGKFSLIRFLVMKNSGERRGFRMNIYEPFQELKR